MQSKHSRGLGACMQTPRYPVFFYFESLANSADLASDKQATVDVVLTRFGGISSQLKLYSSF